MKKSVNAFGKLLAVALATSSLLSSTSYSLVGAAPQQAKAITPAQVGKIKGQIRYFLNQEGLTSKERVEVEQLINQLKGTFAAGFLDEPSPYDNTKTIEQALDDKEDAEVIAARKRGTTRVNPERLKEQLLFEDKQIRQEIQAGGSTAVVAEKAFNAMVGKVKTQIDALLGEKNPNYEAILDRTLQRKKNALEIFDNLIKAEKKEEVREKFLTEKALINDQFNELLVNVLTAQYTKANQQLEQEAKTLQNLKIRTSLAGNITMLPFDQAITLNNDFLWENADRLNQFLQALTANRNNVKAILTDVGLNIGKAQLINADLVKLMIEDQKDIKASSEVVTELKTFSLQANAKAILDPLTNAVQELVGTTDNSSVGKLLKTYRDYFTQLATFFKGRTNTTSPLYNKPESQTNVTRFANELVADFNNLFQLLRGWNLLPTDTVNTINKSREEFRNDLELAVRTRE